MITGVTLLADCEAYYSSWPERGSGLVGDREETETQSDLPRRPGCSDLFHTKPLLHTGEAPDPLVVHSSNARKAPAGVPSRVSIDKHRQGASRQRSRLRRFEEP